MYKKVDARLDFQEREKEVLEFWKSNGIFEKTLKATEGKPEFSFYDGPPTANGKPHIGHILTRAMKDLIPRYKTMKGFHVRRQAGWDTHGLPVELEVEKLLGIDGKQEIEKYGIEPFTKKCKESVWKYKAEWERMSERVGFWADMDEPYITYEDDYIESVWWSLKNIFDKGLIYKGHKIVPYCPRCGTALSTHEVAQGYKDVKEKSIVAKFKVAGAENTFLLAWTTTPWTLPSNVALCVNPKENYVTVKAPDGNCYILAEALAEKHFTEYETIKTQKGKTLEKTRYEPLFAFKSDIKKDAAWYVTSDPFVTLSDGTGIVHIAPAFGEDDAKVGRKYGLPFVQLVDERGRFTPETDWLAGKFCKDADKEIIRDLKTRGLLLSELMYEHSYPYCWRCDTPLLYYARATWFIRMSGLKDRLLKNNATINWLPDTIGKGRFGNFLEGVVDWGLSRERYWGTPLPIWVCPDCGETRAIGSKSELKELSGIKGDIELHKPYVDGVTIKCACGKVMRRTPEVIDCWYDSGSMPFAQMHYPFENKELFEKTFPADFISEAVDQTRGWFYTLLAISTLLFDESPFRNCLVLGHVCDKNGEKMSKHKGNGVDPWSVLDAQGADAVRWYFYTASNPWLPYRFYSEAVSEAQRKFMGTLWNVYSFYVLYADIDKYDPTKYELKKQKLSMTDRWILSELQELIAGVDKGLENYDITGSARRLQDFADDLSNWYVRRSRDRFWGSGMTEDKAAAFTTLYTVLKTVSAVAAPFVPFMTESIWQNIVRGVDKAAPLSVHLAEFPVTNAGLSEPALGKEMRAAINAAQAGRAVRNAKNIKNRQPLGKMYVAFSGGERIGEELLRVVADELNVLDAEIIKDAKEFVRYELKPQLKTLGPKYGAKLSVLREILSSEPAAIMSAVKNGGVYKKEVDGTLFELYEGDLLVSALGKPGYDSDTVGNATVILDTALSDELRELGIVREAVSKVQTLRKDSGFVVTDRIHAAFYSDSAAVTSALEKHKAAIAGDVLAESVNIYNSPIGAPKNAKEFDLNGELVLIAVERVEKK